MDDLLREFLTETHENIDVIDAELVRFEQEPNNAKILDKIFRLVHTIKGTCGFLNLPRLEALTHAAETLMGRFRDGARVTSDAVTLILATIDRIKALLGELERNQAEQAGDDQDLISRLHQLAAQADMPAAGKTAAAPPPPAPERPLRPGEVPLDELERVFRETPGPARARSVDTSATAEDKAAEQKIMEKAAAIAAKNARAVAPTAAASQANEPASRDEERQEGKIASKSIRVH